MGPYIENSNLKSRNVEHGLTKNQSYQILDIEIDRGCEALPLCDSAGTNIPLYKYHEIPGYLKGNPYVMDGYRSLLPFSHCLKSLFLWTNESINVWTHLIGFVIFFFLMIWDNAVMIPERSGSTADHFILSIGLLCYQFCMLSSSGYHLFMCHSERAGMRWLALDLTGISVGILGCYLPAVHYAFYCLSIWRDIYLMIITILFGAVLYFQTQPRYYTDGWFHKRIFLYCGLCAYGVIPTVHWVYLNGGLQSPVVQLFVPKVTVMYGLGIFAFFFYVTKFPEVLFPGKFDFIGSSHQWWHVIVVAAFLWWHRAGQEILEYRLKEQCGGGAFT